MGVQVVSARFAGPDLKPAHREIMRKVATLIVRNYTERELDLLTRLSFDVHTAKCCEELAPSRVGARKDLWRLEQSAIEIHKLLRLPHVETYLSNIPDTLKYTSLQLAAFARKASNLPSLVSETGETIRGAGKALPPGQAPSKSICAAIIAEVWAFNHDGNYPAATNVDACRAAHLLFHSHTGTRDNSWGVPENGWKRHFNKLDDPNLVIPRDEVRRLLSIVRRLDTEHK